MEVSSSEPEEENFFDASEFIRRSAHYSKGASVFELPIESGIYPIYQLKKRGLRYRYNLPFGLYDELSYDEVIGKIIPSFARMSCAQISFNIGPGVFAHSVEAFQAAKRWGFECVENTCHILNTQVPIEVIFDGFNATRKKHIKRYQKSGTLNVFRTKDPSYFSAYFQLYEASAKRWGSFTAYSKELLSGLHEVPGVYMWVAENQGEMLSGMICFYHKHSVFDWLAATIINDEVKKLYPAVAVQYEVIRHACAHGYSFVNMGASTNLHGVSDFKDSWGTTTQKTYTFIRRKGLFAVLKRIQGKLFR